MEARSNRATEADAPLAGEGLSEVEGERAEEDIKETSVTDEQNVPTDEKKGRVGLVDADNVFHIDVKRFNGGMLRKPTNSGPLQASELARCKMIWIKSMQQECYSHVLEAIQHGKKLGFVSKLGLFIDEEKNHPCQRQTAEC